MTTVTVLGAPPRTGRPLIDRLLKDGYDVQALMRSASSDLPVHDRLHILTGDDTNPDDLEQALAGSTAVFSCLGTDQQQVLSTAIPHLVTKMKEAGIERIVFIGTAGILEA
jgi:putative NADH-flavin reductase